MKNSILFLSLIIGVLFPFCLKAQLADPMENAPTDWYSKEIIMVWGQPAGPNQVELSQKIVGVDYVDYILDQTNSFIERVPNAPVDQAVINPGQRPMAVAAADIDEDSEDELMYAVGVSGGIKIAAPGIHSVMSQVDSSFSLDFTSPASSIEIPTGVTTTQSGRGVPFLVKGNFDVDNAQEFALATRNSDGNIVVQIIDTDTDQNPVLKAAISDESTILDQWEAEVLDICSGDFDNDGIDELAVVCLKPNTSGDGGLYSVFLRIYSISDNGNTIFPKLGENVNDIIIQPEFDDENSLAWAKVAVQAIRRDTLADQLLIAYGYGPFNQQGDEPSYQIKLYNVDASLGSATVLDSYEKEENISHSSSFDLACGDLTASGNVNAVSMAGNNYFIFSTQGDSLWLNATNGVAQATNETYQFHDFGIADLDKNGKKNIIRAKYEYESGNAPLVTSLRSIEFDADYTVSKVLDNPIITLSDFNSQNFYFALTLGNFDGDDIRVGQPNTYTCEYRRPIMVLSPPPTHFDHIQGVNYDQSGCYTGGDCLFRSSNTIVQSTSSTIGYTEENDWSLGGAVNDGYSIQFEGMEATAGKTMKAKYGEQYSHEVQNETSQTISVQSTTTIDDLLKGKTYPIKIVEYPVFNAIGTLVRYITAAFPQYQEAENYEQQGKLDMNYMPYYEPGNLLSYPPIGSVEDFDSFTVGASLIYEGAAYTMTNNPGSSSNANITNSEIYSNGTNIFRHGELSDVTHYNNAGFSKEVENAEGVSDLQINTSSMSGDDGFGIQYDNIGGPSGYFAYTVKPYLFWTKQGISILAFQVDLNTSTTSPTWWDITYGTKSDPALMMPLRNEVYWTSGADSSNVLFSMTKSLIFSRINPNVGDTVMVTCRVYNYSLKNTPGPVKVRFYNGNPDMGGELVQDIYGETTFETDSIIPAREKAEVQMKFFMMDPVVAGEDFVRFYAELDPENEYTEVHEDNNFGWSVIGRDCLTGGTPTAYENPKVEDVHAGMWVWPSPAVDQITLRYKSSSTNAQVQLFDMQGKMVLQQNVQQQGVYRQEYTLQLPDLVSGIYLLRLTDGKTVYTNKIMIQ